MGPQASSCTPAPTAASEKTQGAGGWMSKSLQEDLCSFLIKLTNFFIVKYSLRTEKYIKHLSTV